MRWYEFSAACPELASIARTRFEERHLALVGTLRADGSPRITPVEPYLAGDDLMLGMMWQSRKARDLLRDPRMVLHSIVTDWNATEGDVKLYGVANAVQQGAGRLAFFHAADTAHGWEPDPDEPEDPQDYHVFALDIGSAGYTRFHEGYWESWSWHPEGGLRKLTHPRE